MRHSHRIHLGTYAILGTIFSAALGTLLHFTFEWSDQNRIVAFFSPVNESTWEHLKMLVFPILLFSILEYIRIGSQYNNFIIAKAIGILVGMISIVMLYYTYTGVIGNHYLTADIIVFLISIILSFTISCRLLHHHILDSKLFQPIGIIIILLVIICFMWFTFFPPKLELFCDPNTHRYGYDMSYR